MPLREIFNRKYQVSLKFRFEVLGGIIRDWFNNWWLLVLSIILLTLGLGLILGFQLVSLESTRWTMSALVQAGAALMGIFYVALGLLWNQANQESDRLLNLIPEYMIKICPSQGTTIKSFILVLAQGVGNIDTQKQEVKEILRNCCVRLLALSGAALKYLNEVTTGNLRKEIGDSLGIDLTDEEEERIEHANFRISIDATAFFRYLEGLETDIGSLKRLGAFKLWSDVLKINQCVFYTQVLHKARRYDRVYVSLWKLRFINYFKGKGIVIISTLWLACLALGLFTLFALDKIPINLLPYIASLPLAIGVIAIGTTLTFGFRAMSVKE